MENQHKAGKLEDFTGILAFSPPRPGLHVCNSRRPVSPGITVVIPTCLSVYQVAGHRTAAKVSPEVGLHRCIQGEIQCCGRLGVTHASMSNPSSVRLSKPHTHTGFPHRTLVKWYFWLGLVSNKETDICLRLLRPEAPEAYIYT